MSNDQTRDKVLAVAEYLGCNAEELWSEMSQLIQDERKEAVEEYKKEQMRAVKHSAMVDSSKDWNENLTKGGNTDD